jgi:hypothetical protein
MAGTRIGGIKTRDLNKELYGPDYYVQLGKKGAEAYKERLKQRIAKPRGFAANRELAREAGAKGGRLSRRGKKIND